MQTSIKEVLALLSKSALNYDYDFNEDNFDEIIVDLLDREEKNWDYNWGASKFVLMPPSANYVVKIPFNSFIDTYEDNIKAILNAPFGCEWDYCMTEVIIYQKAKDEGLEEFFCKTELIGDIKEYPIYIQERAKPGIYYSNCNYSKYELDKRRSKSDERKYPYIHEVWQLDFIKEYGEARFEELMNFIKKVNISDLRDDNIGYKNGKPVLIDYSSWYE